MSTSVGVPKSSLEYFGREIVNKTKWWITSTYSQNWMDPLNLLLSSVLPIISSNLKNGIVPQLLFEWYQSLWKTHRFTSWMLDPENTFSLLHECQILKTHRFTSRMVDCTVYILMQYLSFISLTNLIIPFVLLFCKSVWSSFLPCFYISYNNQSSTIQCDTCVALKNLRVYF